MLGVHTVELAHALGEVTFRCLDDEMIVIGHLAIGVAAPVEAGADVFEQFQPGLAIGISAKDVFASVTARGDVIQIACEFDA